MCLRFSKNKECLFCDSPGEARDVVRKLASLGIKVFEISLSDQDREDDIGFRVVKLDISKVKRGELGKLTKMASQIKP